MNMQLPEAINAGDEVEVQLAPLGTYPQIVDGEEVGQVVDEKAVRSLIDTFDKEVLVDSDHDSETGKGTEAMAWVTKVFEDPERGLVGVFKFTDKGADAVTQRRYRFISPAWTLDGDNRPVKLVSVGMTNKPNLPVAPVLNMRLVSNGTVAGAVVTPEETEEGEAASAVQNDGNPPPSEEQEKGKDPNMDQLKTVLGLPAEATDEEVITAVQALVAAQGEAQNSSAAVNEALGLDPMATNDDALQAIDAVKNQLGDLQQAQANAEADAFVAENEDVAATEEEKAELKNEYMEDPEQAQKTVANARRMAQRMVANASANREAGKTVVNAAVAKAPALNSVMSELAGKSLAEQNKIIKAHFAR